MTDVRKLRILIVDDQSAQTGALCDVLRQYNYEAEGCVSAEAAQQRLQTHSYDLMLSDLNMPGLDGISLVKAALQRDPDLACIIMTGEGSIASAVRAMQAGALDYIVKPFKASSLLPVLARAQSTRALRIANAELERQLRLNVIELAEANYRLEQARTAAEQASTEKSRFLSNMSHELRTPLNGILGFAQILAADKLPATQLEKQRFARNIVQSGQHLLKLVNEILDLARIEAGKVPLALEAVDLPAVLQECRMMVTPLAAKHDISLGFGAVPQLRLRADRTRLVQVLINLLSNAIKYNREQGKVAVACSEKEGKRLRISVTDTGPGLEPDQVQHIFQPFNRLGRDEEVEGSGLGLALTRRVVEAMQGDIGVDSKPGQGSTFWVELPLAQETSQQVQHA
ncbi:response regulator [Pseudoduganella sp. DS3]|uniref:histidine kinase n=1 Tax=Pseudoduganella guangdongensis TaxID=2692179 RepID=A0A6N9HI76_9BURK|nr:ATP-binding protein [Pseudoduganella guangdongensis]MYN03086.1 response regulator [Pseudoduganella guangdongensis]